MRGWEGYSRRQGRMRNAERGIPRHDTVVHGQGHAVHVYPRQRSVKQLHVRVMNDHCSSQINAA